MTKEKKFPLGMEWTEDRAVFSALIVSLVLSGYGCSEQGSAGAGFSMPPMPVEVALAQVQTIADRFEAVGTIEAAAAITVMSGSSAMIFARPSPTMRWSSTMSRLIGG